MGPIRPLTDGIYAATFFISDISNRKARQFSKTFKRRFGKEPDDKAATHYDAAAIAVEAIRKAKIEIEVGQSRKNIRNQLSNFRYIETAHKGITGRIFFDEHGDVVKPFPIGVYSHGRLISAPTQLGPIVNLDTIIYNRIPAMGGQFTFCSCLTCVLCVSQHETVLCNENKYTVCLTAVVEIITLSVILFAWRL